MAWRLNFAIGMLLVFSSEIWFSPSRCPFLTTPLVRHENQLSVSTSCRGNATVHFERVRAHDQVGHAAHWIGVERWSPGGAATLPAGFTAEIIAGPWIEPVGLTFEPEQQTPGGRMYVWERAGRVWMVEDGIKLPAPLIDLSEEVGGWRDFGLLGFAIDPGFRLNGHIYLAYTVDHHHLTKFGTPGYDPTANEYFMPTIHRVTRYTARASDGFRSVDPASRKILVGESITNGFPSLYQSHGIGSLVFGTDGTLLVSCGDGASYSSIDVGSASETYFSQALAEGIIRPKENIGSFRAQVVDSLSGKIIRIDPETGEGIPAIRSLIPRIPVRRDPGSGPWACAILIA
jgi:hypothetical protein